MTKEDKELLLQDLCARLPYDVQCEIGGLKYGPYTFGGGPHDVEDLREGRVFKPYLRPMESMTVEEWLEWCDCCAMDESERVFTKIKNDEFMFVFPTNKMKFLYSHHFDFLGLIEKGLAIEVTKENNPYERF